MSGIKNRNVHRKRLYKYLKDISLKCQGSYNSKQTSFSTQDIQTGLFSQQASHQIPNMSRRSKCDEDCGFAANPNLAKAQHQTNTTLNKAAGTGHYKKGTAEQHMVSPFLTARQHNSYPANDCSDYNNMYDTEDASEVHNGTTLECTLKTLISNDNVVAFAQGIAVEDGEDCYSKPASRHAGKILAKNKSTSSSSKRGAKSSVHSSHDDERQEMVHRSINRLLGPSF